MSGYQECILCPYHENLAKLYRVMKPLMENPTTSTRDYLNGCAKTPGGLIIWAQVRHLLWEDFAALHGMFDVGVKGIPDVAGAHVVAGVEDGDSLH